MTKRNLIIWLLMFIPSVLVELLCYILAPLVALFTRVEQRTDRVKRKNNAILTLPRTYLAKSLMWFQTHDNAVDEWWYGAFNTKSYFKFAREATQEDYDSKAWFRWFCRVMWLWRNCAYGFLYNLFGRVREYNPRVKEVGVEHSSSLWYRLEEFENSFKFELQLPIRFTNKHLTINVGWKAHDNFPRVLYANRIIGFRTNKK